MKAIKKLLPSMSMKRKTEDIPDMTFVRTLGTGSFGRVFLAKSTAGEVFAVKRLKKKAIMDQRQNAHVIAEKDVLSKMDHPFCVKYFYSYKDDRYLYLVIEFVPGGEFFFHLRKQQKLSVPSARFYSAQVVMFFEYLHGFSIVYRDLKPENLLIGTDGYLKFTDFGFAKIVTTRTYTLCGTPEYLAPEIILNKGHGKPADWWALGIFIFELLVGYGPFAASQPLQVYQNIINHKIRYPHSLDPDGKSIIRHLLQQDVTRRYGNMAGGVGDITSHRFFAPVDWDGMFNKMIRPPYKPSVKAADDTSYFEQYQESVDVPPVIVGDADPFDDW